MIVTVYGTNYTGEHFRGFESDVDGLEVMVRIVGDDEHQICEYILDNFTGGHEQFDEGGRWSIAELAKSYENDDLPQWDGCGGVVRIEAHGRTLCNYTDCSDADSDMTWLDIGVVDLTTTSHEEVFAPNSPYSVNKLVEAAYRR